MVFGSSWWLLVVLDGAFVVLVALGGSWWFLVVRCGFWLFLVVLGGFGGSL